MMIRRLPFVSLSSSSVSFARRSRIRRSFVSSSMKNQINRNSKQQQVATATPTSLQQWKKSLYAFGVGTAAGFTIGVRSYRFYRFFFIFCQGIFLSSSNFKIDSHTYWYFVCLFDCCFIIWTTPDCWLGWCANFTPRHDVTVTVRELFAISRHGHLVILVILLECLGVVQIFVRGQGGGTNCHEYWSPRGHLGTLRDGVSSAKVIQ